MPFTIIFPEKFESYQYQLLKSQRFSSHRTFKHIHDNNPHLFETMVLKAFTDSSGVKAGVVRLTFSFCLERERISSYGIGTNSNTSKHSDFLFGSQVGMRRQRDAYGWDGGFH